MIITYAVHQSRITKLQCAAKAHFTYSFIHTKFSIMKVHTNQSDRLESTTEEANSCCGTIAVESKKAADPCCEQPTDGTSCCDKSVSQEENSKTTGCC